MNRVLQWLFVALILMSASAYATDQVSIGEQGRTYFAFSDKESAVTGKFLWGIMDQEGRVLFHPKFEDIPIFFSNNRFFVRYHNIDRNEYYYYLYTLEPEPQKLGERYREATPFYDGVALVSRDDKHISLIDTMGRIKLEVVSNDGRPVDEAGSFHNGCAYVKQGELYGFINTSGQVHIPLKYIWITHFGDGYALAIEEKYRQALDDHDYAQIEVQALDTSGRVVGRLSVEQLLGTTNVRSLWPLEFNRLEVDDNPFVRGRKVVNKDNGSVQLISIKGEVLRDYSSKWIYAVLTGDNHLLFTNRDKKMGLATIDGQVLLEPQQGLVTYLRDSRFYVIDVGDIGFPFYIVDNQGKKLSDTYKEIILKLANGNIVCWGDDSAYLVRATDGRVIASFESVGVYSEEGYVFSHVIDVEPKLRLLNVSASGIDRYSLETRSDDIIRQEERLCSYDMSNTLSWPKWYSSLTADYSYHYSQAPRDVSPTASELPSLKPDSLVVRLFTDSFLGYIPNEVERQKVIKQVLHHLVKLGKLVYRSDNELIVQSASGTYLRVYVEPGVADSTIVLVYSYSLPAHARSPERLR